MAYERTARRRHRRSAVGRAWLYSLWLSVPGLAFAGILVAREKITFTPALLIFCCLLLYLLLLKATATSFSGLTSLPVILRPGRRRG